MELVVGPSDRTLNNVEDLLDRFLGEPTETGNAYMDYTPTSPPDELVPEDIAVTMLMNSYASGPTFLCLESSGGGRRAARITTGSLVGSLHAGG